MSLGFSPTFPPVHTWANVSVCVRACLFVCVLFFLPRQLSEAENDDEGEEGEDTEFSFVPRGSAAAAMDEDGENVAAGTIGT